LPGWCSNTLPQNIRPTAIVEQAHGSRHENQLSAVADEFKFGPHRPCGIIAAAM
jgi:hypothetical protein